MSFINELVIQISHLHYSTDQQLATWLEQLEVRSDSRYDALRWSTPGSKAFDQSAELLIHFNESGGVEVTAVGRFTRPVIFLNADSDDAKLQQLLDLLINCWAEAGMIGIDLVDVYTVWESCERVVIDQVQCIKDLPDYCFRWSDAVAPRLGSGKVSALEFIYREYQSSLDDFSHYADLIEAFAEEDSVCVLGLLLVAHPAEPQPAVLLYGMTEKDV